MYQDKEHTFFNGQLVTVVDGHNNPMANGVIFDDQVDPNMIAVDLKDAERRLVINGSFLLFFPCFSSFYFISYMNFPQMHPTSCGGGST